MTLLVGQTASYNWRSVKRGLGIYSTDIGPTPTENRGELDYATPPSTNNVENDRFLGIAGHVQRTSRSDRFLGIVGHVQRT